MEVSSFLYVGVDPDTGDPSSIKVFEENDFISSSRLPDQVRNVVDYTTEQSGTFGAGSLDSDVSGRWESTYEEVRDTSANLRQASSTLNSASGNWQDTYEEVKDTSANLRQASSTLADSSGFWQGTYEEVSDTSAGLRDVSSAVTDNSSVWQVVRDTSATWDSGGEAYLPDDVSGRWESTYEEVRDTSANLRQASSTLADSSGRWESTYEEVRDTSANLRQASSTLADSSGFWQDTYIRYGDASADLITASGRVDDLIIFSGSVEVSTANLSSTLDTSVGNLKSSIIANTNLIAVNTAQLTVSSPNWNSTYEEVRDTSANLRDVSSLVGDNSGAWAVTSGIASGFGFIPNGPTKVLSSVEISGFGPGDPSGVSVFDGAIPVYSSALGRFNYLPDLAKPEGGYGARWDPELGEGGAIKIGQDGTFIFTSPDGQNSVMIDTSGNYLSGTATFDMSGIRRLVAATIDSNTTSAVNLTVEDQLNVQSDANVFLPRGYRATSQDRFAVNGSGIGSGADNLYVINGAGPFIYYETSTNGSIRNGANELGLGATPGYTISSIADSYLSGTIPAFYDNSAYYRTVVSSTGVYEIQAMLNVSAASEIDVVYYVEIDDTPDMTLADTIVGISAPHFRLAKLQKVKFLNAGQEIKITIYAGAQHIIGSGSNLLIRRIG